ncbi:MAG: cyclic nucleotide-binding domain-containing protein [Chloroflexi bacterium]|nr:MAG: cyclic nucleotide-binding domain-containing protein [Chloroflexota bacterium]
MAHLIRGRAGGLTWAAKRCSRMSPFSPNLAAVTSKGCPSSWWAGEVIIKEGDQAAGFFVISSGKVEVVRGADGGSPQVLNTLGPGDFFGEMALFEGFPRNATVRAVEDSECLAMTRWDFMAEMKNHPEIAVSMLPVLVRRLRSIEADTSE